MDLQNQKMAMQNAGNPEDAELTLDEKRTLKHAHLVKKQVRNVKGLTDEGGLRGDAPLTKEEYDLVLEKGTTCFAKPQVRDEAGPFFFLAKGSFFVKKTLSPTAVGWWCSIDAT